MTAACGTDKTGGTAEETDININILAIEEKDNMTCSMMASNGKSMFYTLSEPIPYSNYYKKSRIIKISPDNTTPEVIYEKEDENGFYFSELTSADFIVWEIIDKNKLTVNKMDLNTLETTSIYSFDAPDIPVVLSFYDQTSAQPVIKIYDIQAKEIREITNITINTPYERIAINNGIFAYLSSENCGEGKQKVVIYDTDNDKELKSIIISESAPIRNLFANDKYFTYMLASEESDYSLYAYNYINDKRTELNSKDSMYIFSCKMIGDDVIINEKNENDIISINIESGEKQNLTKELSSKHNFYLQETYKNLCYVLNDIETPEIVYFEIK